MSQKNDDKNATFLSEAQTFGKASGKVDIGNLDEVLQNLTKISKDDAVEFYRNQPEESWEGKRLAIYCHDCRDIVPAEIKTIRKKQRKVCGVCGSVKISAGTEEALRSFYHIDERKGKEAAEEGKK